VSEWLLKASPLILIALGLTIGFRANVWNIGAEGMFTMGAIAAGVLALRFGDGDHRWLLPAMIVAGALGGMAWAAIPAFLKARANANEILVTLMLNYVAALILSWLVNGPMKDPEGLNYPQTALFGPSALFPPLFEGLRVNGSIFITLVAIVLTWLFLDRSFLGFQMKVGGAAPVAARYAGYKQSRAIWLGLLISGGTAGLAGMMEAAGPLGQLTPVLSPGYGFAAIIVAFVGRLTPIGVVFGGLLLSLLYLGGEAVQMSLNLPASLPPTC
jgi:simple sugar transport system permease protein